MKIIGIDAGIASVGWAVLDMTPGSETILGCGTRMFDAPETDKERTPTNSIRRLKRGMRKVVRRRRQRMHAVRRLLVEHGLLPAATDDALALRLDPWCLRAAALDRKLAPSEFAVVLGHIARHRGFRSNAKSDRNANAADESSKLLAAIAATRERLGQYRSVGEMFAKDDIFAKRKRNRGGGFTHSMLRDDQAAEVRRIFADQRRLGNAAATDDLAQRFADLAFTQRPLADSEHLVGPCPFFPSEKRAARRSHAFELFRLYARLNTIRIAIRGADARPLTADEIALAAKDFGAQKTLSWKWLRTRLDLDPAARFADVAPDDEKRDFVARAGAAAEGSYAIRQAVGEAGWRWLIGQPDALDRIAAIMTFQSDLGMIASAIDALHLEKPIAEAVIAAAGEGKFNGFTRAGHISAKAARVLLPHLARGLGYPEACAELGFDHAARAEISLDDVKNPVARKAVSEVLKQVKVLVHEFGLPDNIHIELARDVGKGAEERDEIRNGIEKRNKERDRLRAEFTELLGRPPNGPVEMLRFELWKEQCGRCLYTDSEIPVLALKETDNSIQIDHILPWSRFGDDSFVNKTLCRAGANAQKRGRTPFEWFSADKKPEEWERFERCVNGCKSMKGYKKRGHYLRRNAAEVEERFRTRNLGDTRYATRLVLDLLTRRYFPDPATRPVRARPGALTAKLRNGWGLEFMKKDDKGKRLSDDRHHALDAIVVAACSEATLNRLTRKFQEAERQGLGRDFKGALDQPWPGFRETAMAAVERVFVSRAERHRARGEAHAATIKQVRERDGKLVVFERRPVEKLTLADLDRMKDADRNGAIIESIRAWIEAGKPKDALPRSHKGDPIGKIRLETKDKPAVPVRGGTADRGDMARVDVFRKVDAKGRQRFYIVPIYPHQVVTMKRPPDRAVDAYKDETEWTNVDRSYRFLFSLYANSLVQLCKTDGEVIKGYFKGLDRSTGAVALADDKNPLTIRRGLGARTLLSLRKFNVDRLGRISEIVQETRTWHGVACT
jgi:CRISPR-associated endonuclease Csn1